MSDKITHIGQLRPDQWEIKTQELNFEFDLPDFYLVTNPEPRQKRLLRTPPRKRTRSKARTGYTLDRDGIAGKVLLSGRQLGLNLVIRLKDEGHNLSSEVEFWGLMLAQMVEPHMGDINFKGVSHPPSSGKSPWHLATHLAQIVANTLSLSYFELFTNTTPRGHAAQLTEKLSEVKAYEYKAQPKGSTYLIVDDVLFTRATAKRCVEVAAGDSLWFAVLYSN